MSITFPTAMIIINRYRADWQLPGVLETLQQMAENERDLTNLSLIHI